MAPWLIVLVPYFGRWPAWINFFVESCNWNSDIHWQFFTDCGEPDNKADNVDYVHLSFGDYKALARERLGIAFDPADPYKLCDLRPCLARIHEDRIEGYPFFGYGDTTSSTAACSASTRTRSWRNTTCCRRILSAWLVTSPCCATRRTCDGPMSELRTIASCWSGRSMSAPTKSNITELLQAETGASGRGLFVTATARS